MDLDASQQDALKELINISFGRAASALSKLTGYRVEIQTPSVRVCAARDLHESFGDIGDEVATVHQLFSGPVSGDALLLLDRVGASTLKNLLTGDVPTRTSIDEAGGDVLKEVGNILLNACLGTLGNILSVHVTFSVPRLDLSTLAALLHSVVVDRQETRYALVVRTSFRLRDTEVQGHLLIVLSVDSLERLLRAIRDSQQRQG